jgi:hypothetical protein
MSPEMLTWLSKTGGAAAVLILALWLFRDRIYFSFGEPPAGVRFRHPADSLKQEQGATRPVSTRPKRRPMKPPT